MLFPTMKEWIYNSITLENTIGWIVIGLFICILLSIAGSYFGFIPVDINSAKSIIDQRIGNLATIIGTSLTVATLLINNVANKKKEYYEIMFKKTYLRGTVVTTLIIFAFLLTISFLKDFLSTEYPDLFCNLYGLSYFLIFVVLFLIGKLFYNLIHVFDPMFLQIGIKDELQKATKKTIYNVLYNDKSTKIYKEKILKPLGIEKITRYMIISGEDKKTTILLHDFPYVINDVRIHDLSNLIKKNKENLIESDYQVIGDAFEDLKNKKEILLTDNFLTFKDKLVKCFKIKKAKNETLNLDNLYKIIQSDLHKIIKLKEKDFNETDLESTLSNYKIIYETYYDYLSK